MMEATKCNVSHISYFLSKLSTDWCAIVSLLFFAVLLKLSQVNYTAIGELNRLLRLYTYVLQ